MQLSTSMLTHQQLCDLAKQWIDAFDIDLFIYRSRFKYFRRSVTKIDPIFIQQLVIYCVQKRFEALLKDSTLQQAAILSASIKKTYTELVIANKLKTDFIYYFFCVYVTKVVSDFIIDHFSEINIDQNLQSEIYIILNFVMLGLQVTPKSYEINLKKFIDTKDQRNNTNCSKNRSFGNCKSNTSVDYKKQPLQKTKRLKKAVIRNQTNMSSKRSSLCAFEQFQEQIKQNLFVKTLPHFKKKKINAREFDLQVEDQKLQKNKHNFTSYHVPETVIDTAPYIGKNQQSTSLNMFFSQKLKQNHRISRGGKIKHNRIFQCRNSISIHRSLRQSRHISPLNRSQRHHFSNKTFNLQNARTYLKNNPLKIQKLIRRYDNFSNDFECIAQINQFQKPGSLHQVKNDQYLSSAISQQKTQQACKRSSKLVAQNSFQNQIYDQKLEIVSNKNKIQDSKLLKKQKKQSKSMHPVVIDTKSMNLKRQLKKFKSKCSLRFNQASFSAFKLRHRPLQI